MTHTKITPGSTAVVALVITMGLAAAALAGTPPRGHPKTAINPQPLPPVAPPHVYRLQPALKPSAAGAINPQPLPPRAPPQHPHA